MSFLGEPKMSLKSECTVNWGATPLPIQEYITSAIDDYFKTYVRDTMVAPNAYTLEPPSFQPKQGLTDEDVRRALRGAWRHPPPPASPRPPPRPLPALSPPHCCLLREQVERAVRAVEIARSLSSSMEGF